MLQAIAPLVALALLKWYLELLAGSWVSWSEFFGFLRAAGLERLVYGGIVLHVLIAIVYYAGARSLGTEWPFASAIVVPVGIFSITVSLLLFGGIVGVLAGSLAIAGGIVGLPSWEARRPFGPDSGPARPPLPPT